MLSLSDDVFQALPFVLAVSIAYWFIRRANQKKKYGIDFQKLRKKVRLNEVIRLLFVAWAAELVCCTMLPTGFFYRIWTGFFLNFHFFRPSPRWFKFVFFNQLHAIEHMTNESIQHGMLISLIADIILNVLMFVPLGLGLPFIQKKTNILKTVLIGFSCTLFIEFVQGFMYRSSTIDDVVCNTLGALLGYLLYLIIKKLFPKFIIKASVDLKDEQ